MDDLFARYTTEVQSLFQNGVAIEDRDTIASCHRHEADEKALFNEEFTAWYNSARQFIAAESTPVSTPGVVSPEVPRRTPPTFLREVPRETSPFDFSRTPPEFSHETSLYVPSKTPPEFPREVPRRGGGGESTADPPVRSSQDST